MKAAPGARSWIAAGVRHELLMRAMPAVRHDLAGPLSLMRMQLLMLRRHAQADVPAPAEALAPRVAQLEEQVRELSQGLRSLREWEWPAAEAGTDAEPTRAELVVQSVSLLRAAFELSGIGLQIAPELQTPEAGQAERWSDAVGLRYLLLGALCHLHDSHDALKAQGRIELSAVEDWGVRMRARAQDASASTDADGLAAAFVSQRAPRHLAIDAVSLQALAEDLGYAATMSAEALTIDLRRP